MLEWILVIFLEGLDGHGQVTKAVRISSYHNGEEKLFSFSGFSLSTKTEMHYTFCRSLSNLRLAISTNGGKIHIVYGHSILMKKTATAEILIIGNEILTGDILDTNSNWLCRLVHNRGGAVSRVSVLPDSLSVVAEAIRQAIHRRVDLLFLSGGLGPTSDDLTLQAVGAGTGCGLVLHQQALEMVRNQYDRFHEQGIMDQGGINPAREKMAWLPEGAKPLYNPVGTAPGVLLEVEATAVICVPGVPSELKAIFEQTLQEFFDQIFGDGGALSRSVTLRCNDESLLEPLLSRVGKNYPDIYTKSLATTIGESPEMDIIMTLAGIGEKQQRLATAFEELCAGITELGFLITQKG